MKRFLKVVLIIIAIALIWNHLPYYYNNGKTVDYITKNAARGSRSMCAGYVIKAMWHGGCTIGLLPAYAYNKTLPQMGFEEIPVNGYKPMKGDISIVPSNSKHAFGHIAVYNGEQWVSDFKQNHILPSRAYKANGKYQIFRATDGWHWKHVWTTPLDWYKWIRSVTTGYKKIKW